MERDCLKQDMSSLLKKLLIKGKGVDEETFPLNSIASQSNANRKTKLKRKKSFNLKCELNEQ